VNEMPSNAVPAPAVLDAFGVAGSAVPLAGGQGRSVLVGGSVFKPAEGTDEEVEWAASLFGKLASDSGFRVPLPLRAADGRSVVDGWTACEFLTGRPGPEGHWTGVLSAGRAFHRALRHVPRPEFLDRHVHPWAVADRVTWGEQDIDVVDDLAAPFSTLRELRRPVTQDTAQLVHGDLTGNVLFAPTAAGRSHPEWPQMLVRALIFRLVAHSEHAGPAGRAHSGEPDRYARAIEVVRQLARS